jgi:carbon storage regulator CsrA
MLVLSRRLGETIAFPGLGITVQVVAVRGGVVRLGVQAPPDVSIMRHELLEAPPAPELAVVVLAK